MSDTVDLKVIRNNGRRYVVRCQSRSDGTGETDAIKVDISTLTTASGAVCTYTTIDRIEYSVHGMNYVLLEWDHTTDDEIATLQGNGVIDLVKEGGMTDPKSAGGTGDIVLTCAGVAGAQYDITLWVKLHA